MATSTMPAHIKRARDTGNPKEGFKLWKENLKRSGLAPVQERLAELEEQGDIVAQFKYYCAEYGDQLGIAKPAPKPAARRRTSQPATPVVDLQAQFQAFLESQGLAEVEDEEVEDEYDALDEIAEVPATRRGPGRPAGSKNKPKAVKAITNGQAHEAIVNALGTSADEFAPRDPSAPATQGKLWKLNQLGLISLKQ